MLASGTSHRSKLFITIYSSGGHCSSPPVRTCFLITGAKLLHDAAAILFKVSSKAMHHTANSTVRSRNIGRQVTQTGMRAYYTSQFHAGHVHCVPKNDTALACYNFDVRQPILIIFGRNVVKKVRGQIVPKFSTSHSICSS